MELKAYLITCLSCKGESRIRIDPSNQVMYVDHAPIIACRYRPDKKWGFECICGNDTRLAPEEKKDANMLIANATEDVIARIVKAATLTPERKFRMAAT